MKRLVGLLLFILAASAAQAQVGSATLSWDPVAGALGYRVVYGLDAANLDQVAEAGSATNTEIVGLTEAIHHFAARSFNVAGESSNSAVVSTWPAPEVVNIVANCTTIPAGVSCDLAVAGFNYDPAVSVSMTYPGVTVISSARLDSRSIAMTIEIASTATGGTADLVISQPWTRSDGGGGQVVRTFAAAVTVTPVILPSPPTGLTVG